MRLSQSSPWSLKTAQPSAQRASAAACGLQAVAGRCVAQNEAQVDLNLEMEEKAKLYEQSLCCSRRFQFFSCLVTRGVRGLQSAPLTTASRDLDPLVSYWMLTSLL
jgi:hypothetical protein